MARNGDYEVGYGKPPVSTRFKKGASGNKIGRPSGSRNKVTPNAFSNMLREEGSRFIEVKEKGEIKKMPTDRAIMRSVFIAAASGKIQAQKLALALLSTDDNRRAEERQEIFRAAVDFKKWWVDESKRRKMRGEPEPQFMFHPDSFHLDYETGMVTYAGFTKNEESYIEKLLDLKKYIESALISIVEGEPPLGEDDAVWDDVKHCVCMLRNVCAALDMPWAEGFDHCPDLKELNVLKGKVMEESGLRTKSSKGGHSR